jgi:hypothetical protein
MTLAIVGTGLVSPYGQTPREHAFFLRALLPPPLGSPFLGPKDKPVPIEVSHVLGAATPVPLRLAALVQRAVDDALAPVRERTGLRLGVLLVTGRPRPGLTKADLSHVEAAVTQRVKPLFVSRAWGSAGVFAELLGAATRAKEERASALLVIAADTFVSLDYVTHYVDHLPSRWMMWPPTPSEGAAALLLFDLADAARSKLSAMGSIGKSAAASSASNDENDEPADGAALSALLRQVAGDSVHYVFGQPDADNLRSREWLLAMARNAERFRAGHEDICLEASIGNVGAAAGAMSIVYGLAALRHRTLDADWPRHAPFLAWAISRDGTRGMASVAAEGI